MIFETNVEKVLQAIENSNRVTIKNASLMVLSNLLFIVSKNILKIRATNLSIGVEYEIPVKSEVDGVVAVDGKILHAFLTTIPKTEKVKFTLNNSSLLITTKNNKTTIKTFPHEDFPTLPLVSGEKITIPKKAFTQGVQSTIFAAAVSDIKPEIASVCLISDKNTLTFVATDSFRLAEKKETLSKPIDFPKIIIPQKNILEVSKVFDLINEDLTLVINENQIAFTTPGIYVTSRVVSGSFPDYKQIFPKTFSTEVVILKQDLLNTLKSANIFSDKFNQITFSVFPNKKKFECLSQNSDSGEYSGLIESTLKGDDVTVSINHRYLIESLSVIPQDSISIGFNGPNKALVVKGVSDNSFTYLLQPMNK